MTEPPLSYDVATLTVENYFGYTPSIALAAVATALYFSAAVIILLELIISRNKNGIYLLLMVLTGLTEMGGYIALIWMTENSGSADLYSAYVAMQVLIVLSPNVIQATTYKTVGKISIVGQLASKRVWLRANVISWGFIVADLVALVVQAVGISIWATEKSSGTPNINTVKLGSWITVAGLGLQLASFCVFTILAIYIQRNKGNKFRAYRSHTLLFIGVYLVIVLVSIRNIFRFVEFTQSAITYPDAGGLAENQTLFYCLETLPIVLTFIVYIVLSPAFLLPKGHLNEFCGSRTSTVAVDELVNDAGNSSSSLNGDGQKKQETDDFVVVDLGLEDSNPDPEK
eukprot:jgi/Picsp_1/6652/NSC_03995-R1_related to rtm1 protein